MFFCCHINGHAVASFITQKYPFLRKSDVTSCDSIDGTGQNITQVMSEFSHNLSSYLVSERWNLEYSIDLYLSWVAVKPLAFETIFGQASVCQLWVLKPQKAKLEYWMEIKQKLPLATLFTQLSEPVYSKK